MVKSRKISLKQIQRITALHKYIKVDSIKSLDDLILKLLNWDIIVL